MQASRFRPMAKLKLWIEHPIELRNVDAVIEVRRPNDELLGHLKLSRGSLDWHGANRKKSQSVLWREFAEWMESEGRNTTR